MEENNSTSIVVDKVSSDFIVTTEKGEWNKHLGAISFALKALVALFDPDVFCYFSVENTGQALKFASIRSCLQLCFFTSLLGSRIVEIVNINYPNKCQDHINHISDGNSNHFFCQSWLHL